MRLSVVRFSVKGVLLYSSGAHEDRMTQEFLFTNVAGTEGHVPDMAACDGRSCAGDVSVFSTISRR